MPGVPLERGDGDGFVIFPHGFQLEVERDWLPAEDVTISEASDTVESWDAFRRDCPVGWNLLTLHVEPLVAASLSCGGRRAVAQSGGARTPVATPWGLVEEP